MIDLDKYLIYKKYNGEFSLLMDHRTGSKKDLKLISERDFEILKLIDDNLSMIESGIYSTFLIDEMQKEIGEIQNEVTPELFIKLMKSI